MSKYVDADALSESVNELIGRRGVGKGMKSACLFTLTMLANAPVADVAPVRHGAWRKIKIPPAGYDLHGYLCNLCGYVDEGVHTMTGKPFPYCPYCGAKMENVDNIDT